jgi:hypothetical protein
MIGKINSGGKSTRDTIVELYRDAESAHIADSEERCWAYGLMTVPVERQDQCLKSLPTKGLSIWQGRRAGRSQRSTNRRP